MCGIVGIVQHKHTSNLPALLQRMGKALFHRGPDDEGVWVDKSVGLGLIHRRLAILDLSPAGHQPMMSASGRYVIVYNGEVYNYKSLRHWLLQSWKGHSDTEVLLAAIEEWGLAKTLEHMNGMFAFALYDRQEKELTLVRDRMGEKPLYYGWSGKDFLFGSELKIWKTMAASYPAIHHEAAQLYFQYGYIPAPYTIYEGVYKLLPGHLVKIPLPIKDLPEMECYWSADGFAVEQMSYEHARTSLEDTLQTVVSEQSISDVPLGCFLSGGVDSSLIAALLQKNSPQKINTYSIGFAQKDFNEAPYAKAVAAHLGTHHTEFFVTDQDARDVIPLLPQIYDEPFADSSQIPTYLVCKLARQKVTVALSGDGADELFGGYTRYQNMNRFLRLSSVLPQRLLAILSAIMPLSALKNRLHLLSKTKPDVYEHLMSLWKTSRPGFLFQDHDVHTLCDILLADIRQYLPDDILVKVDRAAMSNSLETRAPFLAQRVVEVALTMPLAYKIQKGKGKRILRDILYQYVPRSLIERPKMGFGVPLTDWLQTSLKEWADALIKSFIKSQHNLIDDRVLMQSWHKHAEGATRERCRLWSVLMYQAWYEQEYKEPSA